MRINFIEIANLLADDLVVIHDNKMAWPVDLQQIIP